MTTYYVLRVSVQNPSTDIRVEHYDYGAQASQRYEQLKGFLAKQPAEFNRRPYHLILQSENPEYGRVELARCRP